MTLTDTFRQQCIEELSAGGQPSVPEEKLEQIEAHRKNGDYFKAALAIGEFNDESPISYEELREMERGDDGTDEWDLGEFMRERADELREAENPDEPENLTREEKLEYLKGKEGKLAENLREDLQNDE